MKKYITIFLLAVSANLVFAGNLIDIIMKNGTLEAINRHIPPPGFYIVYKMPYSYKDIPQEDWEYESYILSKKPGRDFYAVVSKGDNEQPKVEYFTIDEYQDYINKN